MASEKAQASRLANSRTYVDKFGQITLSQVMENRGIVKISQVGHIFAFFVFRARFVLFLIFRYDVVLGAQKMCMCEREWGRERKILVSNVYVFTLT
ncbi:CLUMA_CG006907, isoform A [Clunio marinus]|uniref:CLUMA_CG006907, isoform A n=1 Tax=Clunio marinus TaxID=568069 RepID=A0A1J1HZ41_9DIPT|nr:CLUMA_CG006907, isoform A [Clunio marinus]